MYSPHPSLHSAANTLLRSGNLSRWRKFYASAIGTAGFSEIDADEKLSDSLPSERVPETDHIKSSSSALKAQLNFSRTSFFGKSRTERAFISPTGNEAFNNIISPRSEESRVKDFSSAARHGSSHLEKYPRKKYYSHSADPEFRSQSLAQNENSRPPSLSSALHGLCKISGCGR